MKRKKARTKPKLNRNDYFSRLSKEVVYKHIFSRLTFKEVVGTSILSRGWKNDWKYYEGLLEFDNSLSTYKVMGGDCFPPASGQRDTLFSAMQETFMSDLQHVMESIQSQKMQGLRVCIDMGHPDKVNEWAAFAARKEVEILDFDFSYHLGYNGALYHAYMEDRNVLHLSPASVSKSLNVLRLHSVDISASSIRRVLSTCSSLEMLCIKCSRHDGGGKLRIRSPTLKHLEVVDCHYNSMTIIARSLTSLKYFDRKPQKEVKLLYVPNLVEAHFSGAHGPPSVMTHQLLSRLRVFKLDDIHMIEDGLPVFLQQNVFENVEQLEILIDYPRGEALDIEVSLLKAFPMVRVLKIKLYEGGEGLGVEMDWKANFQVQFINLVEMEVSGYKGNDHIHEELLRSLIENAPTLVRFVVDPLSYEYLDRTPAVDAHIRKSNHESTKQEIARLKQQRIPAGVQVVVLG